MVCFVQLGFVVGNCNWLFSITFQKPLYRASIWKKTVFSSLLQPRQVGKKDRSQTIFYFYLGFEPLNKLIKD